MIDLYTQAKNRVENTPELAEYADTILYDWPEGDQHLQWVITAPVAEIVNWARMVDAEAVAVSDEADQN